MKIPRWAPPVLLASLTASSLTAAALVTATPALAKSGVELTVSAAHVRIGQTVTVSVAGSNDAAGWYTAACIEAPDRLHRHASFGHHYEHGWRRIACSRPVSDSSGDVAEIRLTLTPRRPGTLQFRGQLLTAPHPHRRFVAQQTTGVRTVHVDR